MQEEYIKAYNALCTALTAFEAAEENPDYDPAFELYKEICEITEEMQNKLDPLFQVF